LIGPGLSVAFKNASFLLDSNKELERMVSYKTIKTVFSQGVTCKEAEIGNQEGKLDNCFPEIFMYHF